MWRCKHVADALARHHYWELPWLKRAGLRLHVALCLVCGRYHRQVMIMQDLARRFHQRETSDDLPSKTALSAEARKRLKDALRRPPGR